MKLLSLVGAFVSAGVLLGTVACDDDSPTAPTVAEVAGRYRATTLKLTAIPVTQDVLKAGGSLTFELLADGTLTGHVTVPSESVNQDFAGTWTLEGDQVDVDNIPEMASVAVEDLDFNVRGNTLRADRIIDRVRIQVVMTKQ